jgi:hypothetical protein
MKITQSQLQFFFFTFFEMGFTVAQVGFKLTR